MTLKKFYKRVRSEPGCCMKEGPLGRANSQCKGLEAAAHLVCVRSGREAMCLEWREQESVLEGEVTKVKGTNHTGSYRASQQLQLLYSVS